VFTKQKASPLIREAFVVCTGVSLHFCVATTTFARFVYTTTSLARLDLELGVKRRIKFNCVDAKLIASKGMNNGALARLIAT
jgi:hypothetical protein